MNNDFQYLKEGVTADLVELLIKDYDLSIAESMKILYDSETYAKLADSSTGLYFQGSRYVYTYLQNELQTGVLN